MSLSPPPPPLRLSSRPLVGLAIALGVGILMGARVGGAGTWLALLALAIAGVPLHAWRTRRRLVTLRPAVLALGVGAAAVALGGLRMATWSAEPPDSIGHVARQLDALDDAPVATVWARIAEVPTSSEWSLRFVADVDSVGLGERGGAVSGRVQASLARTGYGDPPLYPALELGDRVRLTGALRTLPRPRNPADFDYGAFLSSRGIRATVSVREGDGAAFLGPTRRFDERLAVAVQRRVRTAVSRFVPREESQAVLLALLLADRSGLDDATTDAFRETGLTHLLAVSGLHVFLVGLAVFALLGPLLMRTGLSRRCVNWTRASVALGLLLVYVLVTGGSVSVVRAFVMAAILVVGVAREARPDTLNSLAAAAIALLVWRPTALFEVGFQLSFAAVTALVTLTPHVSHALPARWRHGALGAWVTSPAVASVAATLGTAPVLLVHFGRVAIGGLLLNLPAIPLTGVTLGSGIATVLCTPLPGLAETFGALASASSQALVWVSTAGADGLGSLAVERFVADGWVLAALALVLFAGALWRRPVARVRLGLAAAACAALSLGAGVLDGDARPRLEAVFLDVGQGDATLLSLPNGRHVLIDAGVRSPYRDEGERTVVPHLERFGIRQLDALVLTHADADHVGGAASVLRSVPVARIVHNGQTKQNAVWDELATVADSLHIAERTVVAGDTLALDDAVRIRVLGPSRAPRPGEDANDASIVLLVEYGATRWLLTGDAETRAEADLVARYGALLRADVVKVGHHGSRTSSSPALVRAASGRASSRTRLVTDAAASAVRYAVVSVAKRNRYGLPDAEPLMRWERAGAAVLQTADEGAVWLRSDGTSVERVEWR